MKRYLKGASIAAMILCLFVFAAEAQETGRAGKRTAEEGDSEAKGDQEAGESEEG